MRSGCGPSAVKPAVLRAFGLLKSSLRCCPEGIPLCIRSCCAAAARTHLGSKRPVGNVRRSNQYNSSFVKAAFSSCGFSPGTGIYGSGFSDGSGFSAEGFTASITNVSPTDPRVSPSMRRRLMNADCEVDFVFIDGLELEQTWRKARQSEGTGASSFSCWSFYLELCLSAVWFWP